MDDMYHSGYMYYYSGYYDGTYSGGGGGNYDDFNYCGSTDHGATDAEGNGCDDYRYNPSYCGMYDDDDFTSYDMCLSLIHI